MYESGAMELPDFVHVRMCVCAGVLCGAMQQQSTARLAKNWKRYRSSSATENVIYTQNEKFKMAFILNEFPAADTHIIYMWNYSAPWFDEECEITNCCFPVGALVTVSSRCGSNNWIVVWSSRVYLFWFLCDAVETVYVISWFAFAQ